MRRLMTWVCLGGLVACGARTALNADVLEEQTPPTNQPPKDSGNDTGADAGKDASDALPPIDAVPPPVDVVIKDDCVSPETNFIYLVSDNDELYSFYPPSGAVRDIGHISCPSRTNPNILSSSHPFSMAVDRKGVANVIFSDGTLYKVSTKTAGCTYSGYNTDGETLGRFGMGFSSNTGGPEETLFLAGDEDIGGRNGLASLDVAAGRMNFISAFPRGVGRMELTGTGDGRLYAFYGRQNRAGTFIGELNKTNATIIGEQAFPQLDFGKGWAFAQFAGDFYMFTTPDGVPTTMATKFDPVTGQTSVVQTFPNVIVGAGVSTCAPDQ